jgi:hypothetical protein
MPWPQGMAATRRRQGDGAVGWARQPHRAGVTVVRRRARLVLCGRRAGWPARPTRPASTRAAARTPSEAMRQPGWPSGAADRAGAPDRWRRDSPTWRWVGGRRVSPAPVGSSGATCGWCQDARADPGWVAGWRPGCWGAGRWIGPRRWRSGRQGAWPPPWPERQGGCEVGHGRPGIDQLVLGGGWLAGRWRCVAIGPAATSHGPPTACGAAAGERRGPAAPGWPAGVVR